MKSVATGPALGGVEDRWKAYPRQDLIAWVRHSQQLVADEHPQALQVYGEWAPTVMPNYTNFDSTDVEDLLAFIGGVYSGI